MIHVIGIQMLTVDEESSKISLPDNAQLVFTVSHFNLVYSPDIESDIQYKDFVQNCTIVKVYDKDNVIVNPIGRKSI